MRARTILLTVALCTVGLAGCLGLSDDGGEAVTPQDCGSDGSDKGKACMIIDKDSFPTTVSGAVTDEAIQPIVGANVTIAEIGLTVQTGGDGYYTIQGIEPGAYTLAVRAPGHISSSQEVTVKESEPITADFILTTLASQEAFMQQFETAGYFEYGWGLGWNVTGVAGDQPGALFWVRDNNCDYDQLAGPLCRGEFELEPPLDTIVFEMAWDASTPLAEEMLAMMRVSDNASIITGEWEFFSVEGESPLHYRMDRAEIDAVMANFTERCENGEDAYCSLNFRDQGWPLQTRVWPGWRCQTDQAGFCAVVQQEYTQYVSAFYNAPAPDGFSVVERADRG